MNWEKLTMSLRALFSAAVIAAVSTVSAQAGTVTQLNIGGTGSLGSYTGLISYDNVGILDISLTNTSAPANGGYITGLVFNIVGNSNATYVPIIGDTFQNTDSEAAQPFGTFEEGAAIGGNWSGGGSPTSGVAVGVTRIFRFNITGAGIGSLTANSFFSQLSSNPQGGGAKLFAVRFKGFEDGGSDKVPGVLVPTPAAAGAGLALLGLIGLRRKSRG